MNTDDRSDSSSQTPPAGHAFPQSDTAAELSPNPTPQRQRRSILGRLAGHWWEILLLWLVVSTPLAYVIYLLIEPTYEAFSLLQVEPTKEMLFTISSQNLADMRAYEPYLLTQVRLITSDRVLDAALSTDPRIAKLPMIKQSEDPKADLREQMVVGIVDENTYLIRVALASTDPEEAAMIVNAVVDAYMQMHTAYHRSANKALHQSLDDELDKLTGEILAKKTELKELERSAAIANNVMTRSIAAKKDEVGIPSLDVVSEEQYARVIDRLIQADLELIGAQAKLETAGRVRKAGEAKPGDQPATAGSATATAEEKLRELESAVEEIKRKRIGYLQYLERVKVQTRAKNSDTLTASMVNQELASLLSMKDILNQKLEQLRFEEKQDVYRITPHDRAGVPKVPSNNERLKYMAAAPVGVLLLLLGWFLMLEINAGPVATSSRAPSENRGP
jgi:polysaccharide biosynthesis transport protein